VRGALPQPPKDASSSKLRAAPKVDVFPPEAKTAPSQSSPQIRADAKSSPQIRADAKSSPALEVAPARPEQSSPQIRARPKSDPALEAAAAKPEQSSPQIRADAARPKTTAAKASPPAMPSTSPALEAASTPPPPVAAPKRPPVPIARTAAPPVKSAPTTNVDEASPISSSALVDLPPSDAALPFGVQVAVIPTGESVVAKETALDAVEPPPAPKPRPLASRTPAEHVLTVAEPDAIGRKKKRIAPLAIAVLAFFGIAIAVVLLTIALRRPDDLTKELSHPQDPIATATATTVPTATAPSANVTAPPPPAEPAPTTSTTTTTTTTETVAPTATPAPGPTETVAPPPPTTTARPIRRAPYEPLGI
jgi:hypothetical protein